MKEEVRFWDRVAGVGEDFCVSSRGGRESFRKIVEDVLRKLDPGPEDVLLDVGCGSGLMMRALAPRVARVHGVDTSEGMVERARANTADLENASVDRCPPASLPVESGEFSRVLCYSSAFNYLMGYGEVEGYLEELIRVTRVGGVILVGDLLDRDALAEYRRRMGVEAEDDEGAPASILDRVRKDPLGLLRRALTSPAAYWRRFRDLRRRADALDRNMANTDEHFWYERARMTEMVERLGHRAEVLDQPDELPFSWHRFDLRIIAGGDSSRPGRTS